MFQAQNKEIIYCTVLQGHYDDERDKTVFHNIRPARPRPRPIFFGLRSVLF